MAERFHFISGLPRSGSTLLAAILRQNPRFHAMMTSPVGAIYSSMQVALSRKTEGAVFIDDAQKRALLRGVFLNYYEAIDRGRVVFDTNRLWCAKLPQLVDHFPAARIICCVRDIAWIMDSIERLIRANPLDLSGIFGFDPTGTVYTRISRLAASEGMVGFALDALREAFFSPWADRLILVDYVALTRQPAATLARLYAFLGETPFAHDFDHVEYEAEAFDLALGTPGLHRVRRRVTHEERPSILPPGLFQRFAEDAFWTDPSANPRGVPIILPG